MQNNPSFMPRESSFLEIEVKPNDVELLLQNQNRGSLFRNDDGAMPI